VAPPDIRSTLDLEASESGLTLPEPLASQLVLYYEVLQRWNRKINLTSLSDPKEAVDRLLIEPVLAAHLLVHGEPAHGTDLCDLGSGGGSPAIPLALALNAKHLLMVESRSRKAAFLRAVALELGLNATVANARFEEAAEIPEFVASFDLVSVRAVRADESLYAASRAFLRHHGRLVLFGNPIQVINRDDVPRGT